jgi:hypothetical protein
MTRSRCLLAVLAVVAAGCGGGHRTPAQVVRAWSAALNRGDEEAAAALFGPKVVSLASRRSGRCERGGGERASVAFRVRDGKIVFFDQIGA